ncbi:MAG: ATP-binding protein [Muribaculaceae bacterium]|nr:ATP-binding protein [Muribaculaceae bacterium]
MIRRQLQSTIESRLFKGKAIILIGARQVGKSTLFAQIASTREESIINLNCDEPEVKELLSDLNTQGLQTLIGKNKIMIIDEAQRVKDIGMTLKRITDNFPDVQLLVTGSSALGLQDKLNEPLTGRKYEYHLYPISTGELYSNDGLLRVKQSLETRLIYGSYPDVINHADEAKELLMNIADSYLYKDLLSLDDIRRPMLLEKILIALALQVGSEVSYNEIAQTVGSDSKTVEKYIDLLSKCYIIFQLNAFSRNIRTELKKSKKIYFYDNGIRNAILQNFAPISLRQDIGALWENFIISERIKANHYNRRYVKSYFWRTSTQQEIDYIEECDGAFSVFEMKWNPKKANTTIPQSFQKNYNVAEIAIVTPMNYLEHII